MTKDALLGTWTLMSYIHTNDQGQIRDYPCGKKPMGFLIYTTTFVSVHIMNANRSQKTTPVDIQVENAESYGGYIGSYTIKDNTITHYPKVCGFIDILNTPQQRTFQLNDDDLLLYYSMPNADQAEYITVKILWKRVTR